MHGRSPGACLGGMLERLFPAGVTGYGWRAICTLGSRRAGVSGYERAAMRMCPPRAEAMA